MQNTFISYLEEFFLSVLYCPCTVLATVLGLWEEIRVSRGKEKNTFAQGEHAVPTQRGPQWRFEARIVLL